MKQTQQKIPIGLWIIIGLNMLGALYGPYGWYFNNEDPVFGFGSFLLGLIFALGLFMRLNFFRVVGIITYFLTISVDIFWMSAVINPMLTQEDFLYGVLPKFLGTFFSVWIIFYLTMPKTKALFGKKTTKTENYKRPYFFLGMGIFIFGLFYFIHSGHFLKLLASRSGLDKNTETVYIFEEERSYKKGEPIHFKFEDPLPVIGLTSSICFITDFVSLKELEKKKTERQEEYESFLSSDNVDYDALHKSIHKAFFTGTAADSKGKVFDFRHNVNTLENNDRFPDKGYIAECAEIYFDDNDLEKKTIGNVKRPRDIKEISLTAQNDFTALYAFWKTSDVLEQFYEGMPDIPDEPMPEPTEEQEKALEEWRKMQEERVKKEMEKRQK